MRRSNRKSEIAARISRSSSADIADFNNGGSRKSSARVSNDSLEFEPAPPRSVLKRHSSSASQTSVPSNLAQQFQSPTSSPATPPLSPGRGSIVSVTSQRASIFAGLGRESTNLRRDSTGGVAFAAKVSAVYVGDREQAMLERATSASEYPNTKDPAPSSSFTSTNSSIVILAPHNYACSQFFRIIKIVFQQTF